MEIKYKLYLKNLHTAASLLGNFNGVLQKDCQTRRLRFMVKEKLFHCYHDCIKATSACGIKY